MENKTTLLKKLSDIIGLTFSKEERQLLSEVAPVTAAPVVPPATPPTGEAKEFKSDKGSVFITGVPADGKIDPTTCSVYTDATAVTPATDGEYKLDNGITITVMSGKVTEVSTATEESQDAAVGEEMKKMVAQMAAQKNEIDELKKLITKSNEATVLLTKTVTKILETPVNFQMNVETPKAKRTIDDLTPLERIQYRNGELTL